jgi:hypothetical protein
VVANPKCRFAVDAVPIEESPVEAAFIAENCLFADRYRGVPSRHQRVAYDDVTRSRAPDAEDTLSWLVQRFFGEKQFGSVQRTKAQAQALVMKQYGPVEGLLRTDHPGAVSAGLVGHPPTICAVPYANMSVAYAFVIEAHIGVLAPTYFNFL